GAGNLGARRRAAEGGDVAAARRRGAAHDRETIRARARQALGDVVGGGRGLAFLLALAERVEAGLGRIEIAYLIESLPCTGPCGSKRVKVKASTYSSSGTPYCRPSDTAMAKLLMIERSAAPSLCMSMKISPSRPSSYSPVRRYTLCPPTTAFWV